MSANQEIKVNSYSGYKGEEKPRSFSWEGTPYQIKEIKKSWKEERISSRGKSKFYLAFRVLTEDDCLYTLYYQEEEGKWWIKPEGK